MTVSYSGSPCSQNHNVLRNFPKGNNKVCYYHNIVNQSACIMIHIVSPDTFFPPAPMKHGHWVRASIDIKHHKCANGRVPTQKMNAKSLWCCLCKTHAKKSHVSWCQMMKKTFHDLERLSFPLMFNFCTNSILIFALPHHIIAKHWARYV